MSNITYKYIKQNKEVQTYISHADSALYNIGYTEHSTAHAETVAKTAHYILSTLGYPERECELAQIAAYMHDIGNVVNRMDHAQSSAIMAFRLLDGLGMPAEEIAAVISAIGNHDERTARAVNPIAAAVILADKCDVRRSRVRSQEREEAAKAGAVIQDIHDKVNYACVNASVTFTEDKTALVLNLTIDEEISSIMEYFEIFLNRMVLCRKSVETLGIHFQLIINNSRLL